MLGRPERTSSRAPTCLRAHGVCLSGFPPDLSRWPSAPPVQQCQTDDPTLQFAERTLRNILPGSPDHSGLMLASRITLPHFSTLSAMSRPKSAGDPGSTVPPRSANRALILGSARAALISLLSLSTISGGAFQGAPIPLHELVS